jgi:hypothetical protein
MGNVVDADRAWLGFLGAPRRMSGDGVAVFLRQSAPRDEATRVQPKAVRTASMPAL